VLRCAPLVDDLRKYHGRSLSHTHDILHIPHHVASSKSGEAPWYRCGRSAMPCRTAMRTSLERSLVLPCFTYVMQSRATHMRQLPNPE
jgi:hypothetical protein